MGNTLLACRLQYVSPGRQRASVPRAGENDGVVLCGDDGRFLPIDDLGGVVSG